MSSPIERTLRPPALPEAAIRIVTDWSVAAQCLDHSARQVREETWSLLLD
jgi:hypothetical protein